MLRPVELAVHDSGAGADALQIVGVQRLDISHAVLVRQGAAQHVGENLHVLVPVRAESFARADAVFVDHAQRSETHVLGVVISREGKGVVTCPASRDWHGRVGCSCESSIIVSSLSGCRFFFCAAACVSAVASSLQAREVFGARQAAGGVERRARSRDRQFPRNHADRHHLQQFAQVAESALAAARSRGRAQDGRHFAAKDLERSLARFGPRDPVQRVLQQGGEGAVVLRRRDGEAVVPRAPVPSTPWRRAAGPLRLPGRRRRSAWGSRAGRPGWLRLPHRGAPRRFDAPVSDGPNPGVRCRPGPGSSGDGLLLSYISLSRYMMSRDPSRIQSGTSPAAAFGP